MSEQHYYPVCIQIEILSILSKSVWKNFDKRSIQTILNQNPFCERHLLSFWRYVWTTPYNCIALFLIGTKNGNVDGTRKRRLMGCVISDMLQTIVSYLCSEWVWYSRKGWRASRGVWVTRGRPRRLGSDPRRRWSSETRRGGKCARRKGAQLGKAAWSEKRCKNGKIKKCLIISEIN